MTRLRGRDRPWAAVALGLLVAAVGCGRQPSLANRSEAAQRQAVVRGEQPAAGGHAAPAGVHGNPGAAAAAPALPADGPVPPAPERPAATLQPGPLDQPAPVAVIEARRAAAIIAATAGHQHGGDYTHRDAGRSPEAFLQEDHLPGAAASAEHDAHAAPGDADGAAPAEAGGEPAALYVCPLHPSVRQAEPGTCPICGSTLERRVDDD